MRNTLLIIALFCMGWTVKAQDTLKTVQLDDVVVTGTKSEIPVEKSGKSIFKITRKEIETSGARSVADILNQVPGLQMDGNFGTMGTNIDYFVRGARSKSTLILIDGVPFNDASGIDQTYDLRLLDLDLVESIEILKGGLSTLYGTGAAAGVINISLKKASNEKLSGNVGASYGSFNTFQSNAGFSGTNGNSSFVFNGGYKQSDGFSAAKDQDETGNFDDDGFEGFHLLGKYDVEFTERFSLGVTISFDDFETDFDAGAFTDSETNLSEYSQLRGGFRPTYRWEGGNIQGKFFINKLDRFFETDFGISDYDAKNHQADVVINQNLSDQMKLIGGLNYQRFQYSEQPDFETFDFNMIDPYATIIYDNKNFNLQVGGRLNIHSDYGQNFVFNINPSYLIDAAPIDIKLFGSYATAFIAPSLTQLFGQFGPNPELDPEESKSTEAGFTVYGDTFEFGGVYFHREDENLIIYTSQYENADGEIETDGLEITSSVMLSEKISLAGNYTYTRRLSDDVAYRIPTHKYGFSMDYSPLKELNFSWNFLHTGERRFQYFDNSTFETVQVDAGAFDLFNLNASYVFGNLTISGTVNNLFDEDYQAVAGFNSVERNFMVGLKYRFN
ncbi:TonB-dependent receptor plug domain-containing protein [Ekhidna sp.]|uniref:TonB-dependent receptor plug domain-containing protein n=1 Tax=Ekhidna sp. TaxID=2608089 RepID=UPI003C7D244E